MTTLTKADIVQAVSHKTNHTMAQSADLVDTLFEMIKQTLEFGEEVLIFGFGKWSVRAKRERRGRNPQTGERLTLAPRKVVTFKGSSVLRNKLNGTSLK
jgi:integration host factor subunit alpha